MIEKKFERLLSKCTKAMEHTHCSIKKKDFLMVFESAKEYCMFRQAGSFMMVEALCERFKFLYKDRLNTKERCGRVVFNKNDFLKTFFTIAEETNAEDAKVLACYESYLMRSFFPELTPEEKKCKYNLLRFIHKKTRERLA